MRALLLTLLLFSLPAFGVNCGNGYLHCISHTLPAITGTITDYMYLVNRTDAHLASSGGLVQHTATQYDGLTVPADDIFTSDAACGTLLAWQFESYNASTGARIVHVRDPSATTGQVIWECYDNASATTWLGGTASTVWPSVYKEVQHLSNGTVLGVAGCLTTCTVLDSTSNANNGTFTLGAPTPAAGIIDGGATGGWSDGIAFTPINVTPLTVSVWAYSATMTSMGASFIFMASPYTSETYALQVASGTVHYYTAPWATDINYTAPSNSVWHQFVVKTVGTSGTLYIDGVPHTGTSGAVGTGTTALALGWSPDFGGSFSGSLDEFRVINADISDAQVAAEYANYSSPGTWATIGSELTGASGVRRRIIQ